MFCTICIYIKKSVLLYLVLRNGFIRLFISWLTCINYRVTKRILHNMIDPIDVDSLIYVRIVHESCNYVMYNYIIQYSIYSIYKYGDKYEYLKSYNVDFLTFDLL